MVKNDKPCPSCSISQEPCIIWLSLMVHMCKLILAPRVSFFFQNLIFQVVRGVKGQKNSLKWQKILSIIPHISETINNMIFRYGTHAQSDSFSRHYFHFFKILNFWVHREVKGQKTVQNDKKVCLLCSISQEPCIIWFSFMVHV